MFSSIARSNLHRQFCLTASRDLSLALSAARSRFYSENRASSSGRSHDKSRIVSDEEVSKSEIAHNTDNSGSTLSGTRNHDDDKNVSPTEHAILERNASGLVTRPQPGQKFKTIVVGGGPAGIAAIGNLLEQGKEPILWLGKRFHGGRLASSYREVPR